MNPGFLGRVTAGLGSVEQLNATQATSLLNVFTSGLKGLAPASGGGSSNFLRADGTWTTPPSGSGNFVESEVDFGTSGNTNVSLVVTGQAWVTSSSKIICSPTMLSTTSRAEGAEDAIIEGLTVAVHSRVAGTGYTLAAAVKEGRAYGKFKVHCTGS